MQVAKVHLLQKLDFQYSHTQNIPRALEGIQNYLALYTEVNSGVLDLYNWSFCNTSDLLKLMLLRHNWNLLHFLASSWQVILDITLKYPPLFLNF